MMEIDWSVGEILRALVCNKLACAIDLLPTLAKITDGELSENKFVGHIKN